MISYVPGGQLVRHTWHLLLEGINIKVEYLGSFSYLVSRCPKKRGLSHTFLGLARGRNPRHIAV